jgi:beta-lactamase class C
MIYQSSGDGEVRAEMHVLKRAREIKKLAMVAGLTLVASTGAMLGINSSKPVSPGDYVKVPANGQSADQVSGHRSSRVNYRRLEERIALLMQDPDMVGLAVGTVERGQIRFVKGYGETRANSGAPVTPDTVFRWASLSKSVASALVVELAEDGRLSLDAPVATMGTTLTLPGDARRVTVADILSHRLGLVRNAWDERLEAGEDPKMLRAALGTLPPYCAPATCYAYQNIAFDTATEIVEQTTSRDYAAVARARLFVPLGMTSTSIGQAGLQGAASWAQPHHRNKSPASVNDSYYRVPAAGGVNSSILDLTLWMRAQMGEATGVLSPKALDTMHRPRVTTPPHGRRGPMDRALADAAYGLGWRTFNYAGHALVGHRGSVDGYGSLILFDPADKSGIVMLWNSNHYEAARLQLEFFDMLYGLPPTDWLELPVHPKAPDMAIADEVASRGTHQ